MKLITAISLLFTAVIASEPHRGVELKVIGSEQRIIGGKLAKSGQFPYQAALFITVGDRSNFCGGSIISNRWILTAAHCPDGASRIRVILGSTDTNNLENGAQEFVVTSPDAMIIHKKYNRANLNNDIALIRLPGAIKFTSKISPIRLPARSSKPPSYDNVVATASGWGKTKDSEVFVTNQLRYVLLKVISNSQCSSEYVSGWVIPSTICVSTDDNKSTCNGDSGGPLAYNGLLIGVTSYVASGGCEKQIPAGFSRVTSYLQWIKDNTGLNV